MFRFWLVLSVGFFASVSQTQAACYYDFKSFADSCTARGFGTVVVGCNNGHGGVYRNITCTDATWDYYSSPAVVEAGGGIYCPALGVNIWYTRMCDTEGETAALFDKTLSENKTSQCGSIITSEDGILMEKVNLTGVSFPLVYSNEKVPGRTKWNVIDIPKTIASSSSSFNYDSIYVEVAGKYITTQVPKSGVPVFEYVWDGLDQNNLPVSGSTVARVGTVPNYNFPECMAGVFQVGPNEWKEIGPGVDGKCGYQIVFPIESVVNVGSPFSGTFGFGGWDFSIHHIYDLQLKTLFKGDGSNSKVNFTAKSNGEKWVPSPTRDEIYVFDSNFKHIRTIDADTGVLIYSFTYGTNNRLTSVIDKYGKQVSLQYSGNSVVSITSPYGQVTSIDTDSNGYISKITNPNNESHSLAYTSTGLLTSFETPNGVVSTMQYDSKGVLTNDSSAAGSSVTLSKVTIANGENISSQSSLGRVLRNEVRYTENKFERTDYNPDGSYSIYSFYGDSRNDSTSYSIGRTESNTYINDSRLGVQRPNSSLRMDGSKVAYIYYNETASLSDPNNPFSFSSLQKTQNINGKYYTSLYNPSTKTETVTTPVGRQVASVFNTLSDVESIQTTGFSPILLNYNSNGLVDTITQNDRITMMSYNSNGLLETVTNALGEVRRYTYDLAGRLLSERLGDNRLIRYSYDSNGNVTAITPPYGETHEMEYNGFNFLATYLPPYIEAPQTNTSYVYNNDRELAEIHRPDGQSAVFVYSNTNGNLDSVQLPNGNRNFFYNSGKLSQAISEDFITHNYIYDGTYVNYDMFNYSGKSFSIQSQYNSDYQKTSSIISTSAGTSSVPFGYDDDGLITSAGDMSYTRNITTGLISQTNLGSVQQNFTYSPTFGELSSLAASSSSQNIYSQVFTRDKLGRIKTSTEKYDSQPEDVFSYSYDKAGRLTAVTKNGNPYSSYSYDYNNNRIGQTVDGITLTQAYSTKVLALGDQHSCALTNSGVKCWGEASYGALGYRNIRDIGDNETPAAVNFVRLGNVGVADLTSGSRHSCVKYLNKEVRCWGENAYGQLGLGNTITIGDDEHPAVEPYVNTIAKVLVLGSGANHNCVVQAENKVSCWGRGDSGQLGYGNTNNIGDDELPDSAGAVNTGVANKIVQLALGDSHTCLLTTNGKVKCWGSNSNNQLGTRTLGVNIGDDEAPAAFGFLNIGETVKQISAAGDHTCALMESGKLKCWGRNDFGQLGLGNTTTLTTAIKLHPYINVGDDVKYVSTSRNNTCVVTVSGNVKCWGLNDTGQLGQGNTTTIGDDESPNSIAPIDLNNVLATSVKAGEKHACAILEDKNAICWGSGVSGRLGYGNQNIIGDNETPSGYVDGLKQNGIQYDAQDRLIAFGTKTFGYNANGDLISESDSATSFTKTFDYDVFGNLKSVVLPSKTVNYKVDASNKRIVKLEGTTVIEFYLWDGDQLVGVADSSGALKSRFVYGSKAHSPDYMIKNGVKYQIVSNHLGSPVSVVDTSNGSVVQNVLYDDFGNISSDSQPGFTPFGFASCLYDQDTKLCRFGARDYDGSIGRWLTKDPASFAGGDTNLYGYVMQDPINLVDTNGYFAMAIPVLPLLPSLGPVGWAIMGGAAIGYAGYKLYNAFIKPPPNAYDPNGPKAPGRPSAADGFTSPKGGDNWVPNPNGKGWGWESNDGSVWVPTGKGGSAHGGPHWDVQKPCGGYENVRPKK